MNITPEYLEVIPTDRSCKTLEGFVKLKGNSYAVVITEDGIWCYPEHLQSIHKVLPQSDQLKKDFFASKGTAGVLEKLAELQAANSSDTVNEDDEVTPSSVAALSEALDEVDNLGWHRIDDVSSDLRCIVLRCLDRDDRKHCLEVRSDASGRRKVLADLPGHVTSGWAERKMSLCQLFEFFESAVSSLEAFFREMDALDAAVWILEPERPTRADCVRRIALGEGSSLRIEVDPSSPRDPPRLQFLGPEPTVGPLREKLDANFDSWDSNLPLLENLEKVLQLTFPTKSEAAREEVAVQCGVCYGFNLQGELPEVGCRNHQCHQMFHASCLLEWLRMLPSSRRVFSTLHGECPYCSEVIVVTVRLER